MTGQKFEFRFGTFTGNRHRFHYEKMGVVIERANRSIVVSGTDKLNNVVYCAIPIGAEANYRRCTFRVVFVSEYCCAVSANQTRILIDFQNHTVANNEGFRVFGEPGKWGTDLSIPWNENYNEYFGR